MKNFLLNKDYCLLEVFVGNFITAIIMTWLR